MSSSDSDDFVSGSSDELLSESDSNESDEEKPVEQAPPTVVEEPIPEQTAPPEEDDPRFIRELEFVQSLANPLYLHDLAKRNFFGDEAFIRYLDYLQYWTTPEYAKFVRYPQAFQFLRLLQDREFRTYVADFNNATKIQCQQDLHWRWYMRNRLDLTLPNVQVKEE